MTAGLQIYGDSGLIQIDADYRGLKLVKRVPLNPTSTNPGYYAYYETEYTPSDRALVGFRVSDGSWFSPHWFPRAQALYGFYPIPGGGFQRSPPPGTKMCLYCTSASGLTIEALLFDLPSPPPATGFAGIEVRDANGDAVFSSDGEYMKVRGAFDGYIGLAPPFNPDGPVTTHYLPTGNHAVIPLYDPYELRWLGSWQEGSGIWYDDVAGYRQLLSITSSEVRIRLAGAEGSVPRGALDGRFGADRFYSLIVVAAD